jgi:hypothetical protein
MFGNIDGNLGKWSFGEKQRVPCYTEKNKHDEGLFHQYFEGLVKDIQIVVSVVSDNRRINVWQHLKIFNNLFFLTIFIATYFIENSFKVGKTFDKMA